MDAATVSEKVATVRMPRELWRALRSTAGARDMSVNRALNEAARLWLEQQATEKPDA